MSEEKSEEPHGIKRKHDTNNDSILHISSLPSITSYEVSYMHRDVVTHICVCQSTQFIITGSKDGYVKFWRKIEDSIEFVTMFRAHLDQITDMRASKDGFLLCTISSDMSLKLYDVMNFDMIHVIEKLSNSPACIEWIHDTKAPVPMLAMGYTDSNSISLFKGEGQLTLFQTINDLHSHPVHLIRYNEKYDVCISIDKSGMIEYWDPQSTQFPENKLKFKMKTQTDLYMHPAKKITPLSLEFSPDNRMFVILSSDSHIRIFKFLTGKVYRDFDESNRYYIEQQQVKDSPFILDSMEFGRRIAQEKEYHKKGFPVSAPIFDSSSSILIFTSLVGIKMMNIHRMEFLRLLGKYEPNLRFLVLALFQGKPINPGTTAASISAGLDIQEDPSIFCSAYKKNRFYLFTNREPSESKVVDSFDTVHSSRDILNELPVKETEKLIDRVTTRVGKTATIHTTSGDIFLKLFPDECPKTIENFSTHSRNGYYNNVIFHRVIKNFMVQTGDPKGDGTGGQSIWGNNFQDEFNRNLRHDRPFTLSMANIGPNTNGSQFFITTRECSWLDNKHTVFGRVTKGADVVKIIENVEIDSTDKPLEDIKILNIEIGQ